MNNFIIYFLICILMLNLTVQSIPRSFKLIKNNHYLQSLHNKNDMNNNDNQENFYNLKKINKVKSNDEKWPSNDFNITTVLNGQVKLPCFIEKGRKFIWMQATRDEILSIDNNLITNDLRFNIESTKKCANHKNHFYNESTK